MLMLDEARAVPAVQRGIAVDRRKGEPALSLLLEESKGTAALAAERLGGREARAVPDVQQRRARVIGVAEEALSGMLEERPIISRRPVERLELRKTGAVPLEDARFARIAGLCGRYGHTLRERQEMPAVKAEMAPLLRGEAREILEGRPFVAVAPIHARHRVHVIGAASGANARGGEENGVADFEHQHVLAAGRRQAPLLDERPVMPAVEDRIHVAVPGVHVRRLAGHVLGKLRHAEIQVVAEAERQCGARAGGRQALMHRQHARTFAANAPASIDPAMSIPINAPRTKTSPSHPRYVDRRPARHGSTAC